MTGKQHKVLVCSAVLLLSSLAWSGGAVAQSQNSSQNSATPLVRVLQAKGILTQHLIVIGPRDYALSEKQLG